MYGRLAVIMDVVIGWVVGLGYFFHSWTNDFDMGRANETRKSLTRNPIGVHSGKRTVRETEGVHTRTSQGDMHELCFVFDHVILIIGKLKADEA